MHNPYFERGYVLYQQHNYPAAQEAFQLAIAEQPEDGQALSWLALTLLKLEKPAEAQTAARRAVALAPDQAFSHFVLAQVFLEQDNLKAATAAIKTTLDLEPTNPEFYRLAAAIHCAAAEWRAAIAMADLGLQHDPEHDDCANLRALALVKLNQRAEAAAGMLNMLQRNPDNAMTHANQGWAHLHGGETRAALESFREALRLRPDFAWARSGIVEALKARNPLYNLLLRYFLWTGSLSKRNQWGVLLGLWLAFQALNYLLQILPQWALLWLPLMAAYLAFALSTWLAPPLFNLLLRFDAFGRLVLNQREMQSSALAAGCVAGAGGLFIAAFALPDFNLLFGALMVFMLMFPIHRIFAASTPGRVWFLIAYTVALAGLALGACALWLTGNGNWGDDLMVYFFWGIAIFTWVTNLLA